MEIKIGGKKELPYERPRDLDIYKQPVRRIEVKGQIYNETSMLET